MPDFDVLIRNGMLIDGNQTPRYQADLGIRDGRIAALGRLAKSSATREVDASGLIVAPGFIDLHTHYDAQVFWDPHCSTSGWHGVTSVTVGNCGFGLAPVASNARERAMQSLTRVEAIPIAAMREALPWDWTDFPGFLESIRRAPKAMNLMVFAPLSPFLIEVMGIERAKAGRRPTEAEHRRLRELMHEAMDAGACGWSAQVMPPDGPQAFQLDYDGTPMVTDVMHDETLLELAEVLSERNEGFIQATIALADPAHQMKLVEQIAETSGRPYVFNAVHPLWMAPDHHKGAIAWLDDCRRRGLRVYGHATTSRVGQVFELQDFNIWDANDAWRDATMGTHDEQKAKFADPTRRPALREAVVSTTLPISMTEIFEVALPEHKKYEGKTAEEVATLMGVPHAVDAILDLAVAEDLRTVFHARGSNDFPGAVEDVLAHEFLMPGFSDGGAHTKTFTAGRFTTEIISEFVRDLEMCSLEHAHWRLSTLPAHVAGLVDRGTLELGKAADVIVYDLDALEVLPVEVAHDLPGGEWRRIQRARGYRYVFVNGELTLENDRETDARSGQVLRSR
jgi:N-acyl-D-aspartate/D-glutamate deacylase